jgi:hypothetical protein
MAEVLSAHVCGTSCPPLLFVFRARLHPRADRAEVYELLCHDEPCATTPNGVRLPPALLRNQYRLVAIHDDGSTPASDIVVNIPLASLTSLSLEDSEFTVMAEGHHIACGSESRRETLECEMELHRCGDYCRSRFCFARINVKQGRASNLMPSSSCPSSDTLSGRSPARFDFPFIPDKQFMYDVIREWQECMHPNSQGHRPCAVCAQ